jgi:hypothetical protein
LQANLRFARSPIYKHASMRDTEATFLEVEQWRINMSPG